MSLSNQKGREFVKRPYVNDRALPAPKQIAIVIFVNISSFHTHTRLCKHATGTPSDYVRQAIKDGCSALGISDHCPYPDDSVWAGSRMSVAQIPQYVEMCAEAKAVAPFPFRWGFECEWYPAYESWYRDVLVGEVGAEYLVYGSHWINDNGAFWYIPEYPEKRILRRYVELTMQGLRSGLYDLFAHPDIFLAGFPVMDDELRAASEDIIACAVEVDIPMEINGLGLHKDKVPGANGPRSPYPVREFWEMASSAGARIVCCSDAHRPSDVISNARNAMAFAERIGIVPLDAGEALLVR